MHVLYVLDFIVIAHSNTSYYSKKVGYLPFNGQLDFRMVRNFP
jgi:hypothetical protein